MVKVMRNKNLILLGLLFVSSILLAGVTVGVSNMVMEMGNPNYHPEQRNLDATPSILRIDEMEKESIEISSSIETESFIDEDLSASGNSRISSFSSFSEFYGFLENHTRTPSYIYRSNYYQSPSGTMLRNTSSPSLFVKDTTSSTGAVTVADINSESTTLKFSVNLNSDSISPNEYSTTNIQVAGVDEGDIIKTDGTYVYVVTNFSQTLLIIEAHPAETAKIVSRIEMDTSIREIYIREDILVVLGYNYQRGLVISTFDTSIKENPFLNGRYNLKASLSDSRMIGDYLYVIASQYVDRTVTEKTMPNSASQIFYFNDLEYPKSSNSIPLTSIISVNVTDSFTKPSLRSILMSGSQNIYVSQNNIYITYTKYESGGSGTSRYYQSIEKTAVHRISIDSGFINYRANGEVPGRLLNRFSMDEYDDHFRMATTTGHVSRGAGSAKNQVYVLDMDLNIEGKLEDIAPGERIYSARFMGNRLYLVTFKKVDPFFVIDVSTPEAPRILGELKIPGYSDYLHPYDENHIIGLGKDTIEASSGNFAWYQGVKLALFDVTDVTNPKEVSKYVIGERGTNSPALRDPHAFLFAREKNLLVSVSNQMANPWSSSYSNSYWDGAYVFDLTVDSGFELKGKISHSDSTSNQSYYWYGNNDSIKRSFYIENVLYTLSNNKLKMNQLNDLSNINELSLVQESQDQTSGADQYRISIP
jgi:uncharacterized secreted protein with C-terminal beta-propeller domain